MSLGFFRFYPQMNTKRITPLALYLVAKRINRIRLARVYEKYGLGDWYLGLVEPEFPPFKIHPDTFNIYLPLKVISSVEFTLTNDGLKIIRKQLI